MKSCLWIAAALAALAAPAAADPVLGMYKTQPGDDGHYGHVQLVACGDNICGVIRKAFDSSNKEITTENIGKRMIWDMQALGGGKYGKGKIWAPDRNKTYNSKMELNNRTLKVSGCVAVVCRAQTWTKIN